MIKNSTYQPIGIFDSGVGGLGVTWAIASLLPHENLVYLADNKSFPFGPKTEEQLHVICERSIAYLIERHHVKIVVVACNTATVSSLAYVRSKFSIPFVGVVPVVKPACEQTKTGCVAILSTPGTAGSAYIQDLIEKFGQGSQVLSISCPGLADMVEKGLVGTAEMEIYLQSILGPLLEKHIDVIGLSCTHYPFLRDQIQAIVGPGVTILDSNVPVARQVKRVLETMPDGLAIERRTPSYHFYVTKEPEKFKSIAQQLVGDALVQDVELVVL